MSRWFKTIGPFKGTLRLTSKFPPAKDSWESAELVHQYLFFISAVDHRRLVFADEKPFKGKDLYDRVRRDPLTGIVPNLTCNANSRNRYYNVFCAISMKEDIPFCSRVVDETGDAILFSEFLAECIREVILQRGDIFIVDNCTIYMQGENEHLQDILWENYGILMMALPPYHPELNPTELVFRALLKRMRSLRCKKGTIIDFVSEIRRTLWEMSHRLARSFFKECGYLQN
jgi:hypothetical protein